MKKLFTLATLALSTYFSQAQTRLVLYEEFTDEGCLSAPAIDAAIETLTNSGTNPYRVNMIKFMTDYISGAPGHFFSMTQNVDSARQNYYGVNYAPFGLMDGRQPDPSSPYPANPADVTQAMINTAAAKPSPFSMSVSSVFHPLTDSITLTVKVKALANYTHGGLAMLRTARCKTINLNSGSLLNGEKIIKNVVRDMYPSAAGIAIANVWHVGDSQTYVFSGPVNPENSGGWYYDMFATDSFAVAWIQNDSDKTVLQSAKEGLIMPVTTGINTIAFNGSMKVWPVPASTSVMLFVNTPEANNASILFYDATGRVCYKAEQYLQKGENKIPTDISNLPVGIYNAVLTIEGRAITARFSVTR